MNSSIVRLHAFVTVNSKDWEIFKEMVAEVKAIVKSEGAKVLTHETYHQQGTFDCLIVEAYENEAALLEHLKLIEPLSQKYKMDWKVNRLELCGHYSEEVVSMWQEATKQGEFFYFNKTIVV